MLMAPSNAPALNGIPSPMSPRIKSPSTSRSLATSIKLSQSIFRTKMSKFGAKMGKFRPKMGKFGAKMTYLRTQHGFGNVYTDPVVSLVIQTFSREPRTTSNVKHKTRLILRKGQKLDGTFRHVILDINHTRTVTITRYISIVEGGQTEI